MTRILHLLDEPPGQSPALAMRLSADAARIDANPDEQHAWLLIGGEPIRHAARAAGIRDAQTRLLPRPQGLGKLVPGAMRAMKTLMDRADRIECWTLGAGALASEMGCPQAVPRFGQATLCGYAKQVIDRALHHPPPLRDGAGEGAESQQAAAEARAVIRKAWGIDDATFVVALLADHPEQVDAREAWLAIAFTFETLAARKAERGDVRLLCHPLSKRRAQADELAQLLGQPQLMMQDPAMLSPWSILRGCDIALAPAPLSAGLSILWADALGLPVIAPPETRLSLLAELPHVQVSQSTAAKHLAHPLTQWAFDRQSVPAAAVFSS